MHTIKTNSPCSHELGAFFLVTTHTLSYKTSNETSKTNHPNTHSQCVLSKNNPITPIPIVVIVTITSIPHKQCRDARLERPLNQWVKKHNHLSLTSHRTQHAASLQPKLPKTQMRNPL